MSTFVTQLLLMLDTLITSKTRIKLLTKFFVNSSNRGYLRGLAREFNESTNSIRKELNKLTKAGYLELIEDNSQKKTYQANQKHPLFSIIQNLVLKQLGLDSLVSSILERMGRVERIIVIGDYAQGIDSGEIKVVIVGDGLNSQYIHSLSEKIKNEINRNVSFLMFNSYVGKGLILYDIEDEKEG